MLPRCQIPPPPGVRRADDDDQGPPPGPLPDKGGLAPSPLPKPFPTRSQRPRPRDDYVDDIVSLDEALSY